MKQTTAKLKPIDLVCIWIAIACSAFLAVCYCLLPGHGLLKFAGILTQCEFAIAFLHLFIHKCDNKTFRNTSVMLLAVGALELCLTIACLQLRYSNLLSLSSHIATGVGTLIIVLRNKESGPYIRSLLQCLIFFMLISMLMNSNTANILSQAGSISYIILFLSVYKPVENSKSYYTTGNRRS